MTTTEAADGAKSATNREQTSDMASHEAAMIASASSLGYGGAMQLCFNRADFTRDRFDVDRFVSQARRHAGIDQVQADLRLYLKIVQNAMIELINDDYAQFVNLSSSLVNLRATLEKVDTDYQQVRTDFVSSTEEMSSLCAQLDTHAAQMLRNEREQYTLHTRLTALNNLTGVKKMITKMTRIDAKPTPSELTRTSRAMALIDACLSDEQLDKHADFLPPLRRAFDACADAFTHILDEAFAHAVESVDMPLLTTLLQCYTACHRTDTALATFIRMQIEPRLCECAAQASNVTKHARRGKQQQLVDHLDLMAKRVIELRDEHCTRNVGQWRESATVAQSSAVTPADLARWTSFVHESLLTAVLGSLDAHFASVLVPTDADTFHACHERITRFAVDWAPTTDSDRRLVKMVIDKWNVGVYYRLRSHQLNEMTNKKLRCTEDYKEMVKMCGEPNTYVHLMQSSALLDGIAHAWQPNVHLPSLTGKLWSSTCHMLSMYETWVQHTAKITISFTPPPPVVASSSSTKITGDPSSIVSNGTAAVVVDPVPPMLTWHAAITIAADVYAVDDRLFDLAFGTIWPRIRSVNVDTREMGQYLTAQCQQYKSLAIRDLLPFLVGHMVKTTTKCVHAVHEVPRQYRWTKKVAPTQCSAYVTSSCDVWRKLQEVARSTKLASAFHARLVDESAAQCVDAFATAVQTVMSSVDKMSSSLNRLKKTNQPTPSADGDATSAAQPSDEEKIRAQLLLDVRSYRSFVLDEVFGDMRPKEETGAETVVAYVHKVMDALANELTVGQKST